MHANCLFDEVLCDIPVHLHILKYSLSWVPMYVMRFEGWCRTAAIFRSMFIMYRLCSFQNMMWNSPFSHISRNLGALVQPVRICLIYQESLSLTTAACHLVRP